MSKCKANSPIAKGRVQLLSDILGRTKRQQSQFSYQKPEYPSPPSLSQYIIMQSQPQSQSPFISSLLARFESDESDATRDLLDQICHKSERRLDCLRAFNLLLNSRTPHARQRRDLAAIARLIADSNLFNVLTAEVQTEAEREDVGPGSLTIELTKLVANICNQNPHLVDNILTVSPNILPLLCSLFSRPETTPLESDSLTSVLNFLHNIALKETVLRTEKVAPCLQALLQNVLTYERFCPFISQKKFQSFLGNLFKFHANVPLVGNRVYRALIKSARSLNKEYKLLAESFEGMGERITDAMQRSAILASASTADKKLIAMMRLFQKAKSNIFSKFGAFSFTPLLKIFVKIAVMRPVALLNQPHENKLLIILISQMMTAIEEYKRDLQAKYNDGVGTERNGNGKEESQRMEQEKLSKDKQKDDNLMKDENISKEQLQQAEQQGQVLPPVEQQRAPFSSSEFQRYKNQSKSFEQICQVTRHYSETCFKMIKSTIQTLTVSFDMLNQYQAQDQGPILSQTIQSRKFLISIMTVRLERVLCMMLKLFPVEQLSRGDYYRQIVTLLLKLLPSYYDRAIEAETTAILQELPQMEQVSTESQGSIMRFIMDTIDEQTVKTFIQGKLLQKINIFSTIYEAILKFVYHLVDDETIFKDNMQQFVHVFIGELRKKHLDSINNDEKLTLRQVQALRLALRLVTELFHGNVNPTFEEQVKSKAKLYRYCKMLTSTPSKNNIFRLFSDILNNLQKHSIESTTDLTDTLPHRQEVTKTILAKIIIQRAKMFANAFTLAHLNRVHPEITQQQQAQITCLRQTYEGYFSYLDVVNDFIIHTASSQKFIMFKQDILGTVISRTLDYTFTAGENSSEEAQRVQLTLLRDLKERVDRAGDEIVQWVLANSHRKIHRLPLLTKKMLHFEKIALSIKSGQAAALYQEQLSHIKTFINKISSLLNRSSLILTGQKMDLKVSLKKERVVLEEVDPRWEMQRVANAITMLAETIKLITSEQYLDDNRLIVSPNYLYSILALITKIFTIYTPDLLTQQLDDTVHASLWLIQVYLHYDQHLQRMRLERAAEKKKRKREMKKERKKELKCKEKGLSPMDGLERQESKLLQEDEEEKEQPRPQSRKRRRRRNKKKNTVSKPSTPRESPKQPKSISKNPSKTNLLDQSQVKTEQKLHQKNQKKSRSSSQSQLQNKIRQYLKQIITFLGQNHSPLIKNDTFAYLLAFLNRHMHRSIVQSPPYTTFQITLSDLIPSLLKIKLLGNRIPGYHFSMCKLGLQLFDDSHIKVDYQLAIKRFMFEQEGDVPLGEFLQMLKDNFKEVTQSTSNFVEIAVQGQSKRLPFVRDTYEGLLSDKTKKATVVLREGVELHLLNTRPDPSRRKSSEQGKIIKVSDYCPQGEIFTFIEHIITHSLRNLFSQLDRSLTLNEKYQSAMQPFTIRAMLQTLQYLVRESPSLGPFIAKFKCKRIILALLQNPQIKQREAVSNFVFKAIAGPASTEGIQEVGYLPVLIRLFSPLVVNAISGLVFELCLDSTPLVQTGKKNGAGHVAFGSVIRLKVAEELAAIMFEPVQLEWLYRKLCLLNLITVLTNIREMARIFIQTAFIPKLYTQFQAIKTSLTDAWSTSPSNPQKLPLPGIFITRLVTPFYLSPLGILQELNISFHYNKKMNKNTSKISICTVLNRESINAQLIPQDALKKYKFKLDWPFHIRRDNLLEAPEQEDPEEFYANEDASSDSDGLSQDEDSEDSENSSYMRLEHMDLPMPEDDEDLLESYMSMEPHEQLLNEEWDYSEEGEIPEYPSEDDHVLELDQERMEMELELEGEGGDAEFDQDAEDDEDVDSQDGEEGEEGEEADIDAYLQQQALSHPDQSSLIDQLNALPSNTSLSLHSQPLRQFALNTVNEQDYYISVNSLLNFQKVQSIVRISKTEKRQVHLLRFLLQVAVLPQRKEYNLTHPRMKTLHENKEEEQVEENLALWTAFSLDQYITSCEFVQYDQIYRYDHYHKETPKLAEEVQRHFADQLDLPRRHVPGRRNAIVARDNLIEIMPGWNITEVRHQPRMSSDGSVMERAGQDFHRIEEEEEGSHIQLLSQDEQLEEGEEVSQSPPMALQGEAVTEAQHIANIQQILRAANIAMTAREFLRLDRETQQDILINIAEQEEIQEQGVPQEGGQDIIDEELPNSPMSFEQPADRNAVQIPNLEIRSREGGLSQGRIIEALSQRSSPEPEGPEPQLQQIQQQAQIQAQDGAHPVHEVYRKMSLQHSKKISKDVMEALNKDGKNNSKFHELSYPELDHLLQILLLTTDQEHGKFPYPLLETLCINTLSLKRVASSLMALLHLTPQRFDPGVMEGHGVIRISGGREEQRIDYTVRVYPSLAMKALHLLTHLTKNYSIAMALLRANNDLPPSLLPISVPEQSHLSSFQLLILLLSSPSVGHSPTILGFLINVLDNVTMHHFYKNVHEIVERTAEEEQRVRISQDSVFLLGELLQSDFVSDNLPLVSKIIMRLSVEEHNLRNFINYLEKLVRQLTDQALEEVRQVQKERQNPGQTIAPGQTQSQSQSPPLKIVNIMQIFYEMVKAFQTFPTSLDRRAEVMLALRRIVQYQKLQQLCETAVRGVFQAGKGSGRAGEVIDCFFVLHEIASITDPTKKDKEKEKEREKEDEHNHIAGLGELDLTEQFRGNAGPELILGNFNLSTLWREAVSQPNFKHFVNSLIRKRITELARRGSPFDLPIVKISAATAHLLSFDNKYALFKGELKRLRGRAKYQPINICLKREDVFEGSFEHLMTRSGQKLRGKLKIQFQDEQGEDAGGITRQWFQLLSREMFNPNYGLFRSGSAGHTYHPSPTSYFNQRHLDYFKFIGRIAGKALYDGYLLDAYFTPAFYKHILAIPITYRDMEQQDYEYFKSMTWILDNSPIEDFLELTFTYDCDNFGEIQTKELVAHGADLPVTEENKLQYVQLIAYAKMATSIKLQLQAYLTGLHQLVPHRLLKIFNEKQLEIMISGRPTIDIEDLRRNTELVNYMKNDPIIVWLFEVLEGFDMELRTAFIQFVTGSSRVPVEGFKDLRGMNGVQRFNIHREFQQDRLPRAHTCFNQLDLPNYATKEILIEKLRYAITEGKEGFGMI